MMQKLVVLVSLLVLTATHAARAQRFVALGMPDSDALAALKKFQTAVAAGDRATVAGMVNFPLRVNHGADEHVTIVTRAELLRRYDAVFTPDVRRAIVAENLNTVLSSTDGVPLGKGVVWMMSTCGASRPRHCRLGLSSVNVVGR